MFILSIENPIVDIVMDFLRNISFFFDGVIYSFIGKVYNLLMEIAQTSVFTDEIIDTFAGRIYALLGIFMLFKVSFSILTYIVSPDDFLDKNKGFAKLISNILITLTLLVATPWLFSQAMDIQRIVLRDNVIGKIFIGVGNETDTVFDQNSAGLLMSYETYKAFYYLDTDVYAECIGLESGNPSGDCPSDIKNFSNVFQLSEQSKSVDIYRDKDLFNTKVNDQYVMTYVPFISVIVGVVVLLLLVVFCFDIAVRSIKLGFLRMLAPIPIVSRIDPKKGKEVFDKWFKSVISTYLDLFIRLIAIYFAIFIISIVTKNLSVVDPVTGVKTSPSGLVIVFIILGALLFAKQLPKLIEEITGFKMDGKFTLNPLKKLGDVPVAGRVAATGIGAVDSLAHGQGLMAGAVRGWKSQTFAGDNKKGILGGATEIKAGFAHRFGGTEDAAKARKGMAERDTQIKKGLELNREKDKYVDEVKASSQYQAAVAAKNNVEKKRMEATAEAKMFKNSDYKASYVDLAVKKQQMYDAKNLAQQAASRHSALETQLAQAQSSFSGLQAQLSQAQQIGDQRAISTLQAQLSESQQLVADTQSRVDQAYADLEAANGKAGKQESIYKMAEKRHDDLKVIYSSDGDRENAMDVAGKIG